MPLVRFKKSGVAYGYAYNFGEVGIVQDFHKQRLVDAGIVDLIADDPAQPGRYETPEKKITPKIEKRDVGSSKRTKR